MGIASISRREFLNTVIPCLADEMERENAVKSRWLDLDLYFRLDLGDGRSAVVTTEMLDSFRVTAQEIIESAVKNIRRMCLVRTMGDTLGLFGMNDCEAEGEMMVMTTDSFMFGAGAMLLTDKLDEIAAMYRKNSLFIIPSSVHEVLVIPADLEKAEEVNRIIHTVNETVLGEGEFLADHLYRYRAGAKSVTI